MPSTKGSFLIASPGLVDPNFRRTVVLMAEHTAQGSFGLVLNRPGKLKVRDLWAAIAGTAAKSEAQAFVGGPVQPSSVFVLHRCEDLAGEVEPVIPGLYLGSDVELLGKLLERESELRQAETSSEVFRLFCGYSGWAEGQLDNELKTGSWLVEPASLEDIFDLSPDHMWPRKMAGQGGAYGIFSSMPPDPELN